MRPASSSGGAGQQHLAHLLTTIIRHQLSPGELLASSGQSWTHLGPGAGDGHLLADYHNATQTNHRHQQQQHLLHRQLTYNSQQHQQLHPHLLHHQPEPAPAATGTQAAPTDIGNKLHEAIQQQATQVAGAAAAALAGPAGAAGDWWRDYWSRQPFPSGYTQSSITLLACLITTIIFLIVVGNLLVCIAIFTEKSLKPTQNWFIASLAVSDMMLGLVVMPFSLARELMGFWIFGTLWCDIHEAIDVLLTTASINTLCLISLDRYWSITQAVSYLKKRTPRRGAFMIAFVWIFSAAVSLPPLFGWKKPTPSIVASSTAPEAANSSLLISAGGVAPPPGQDVHHHTPVAGSGADLELASALPVPGGGGGPAEYPMCQLSDDVGYVLYSALGSFFLPCAVMVFTYIKIFLAARSRARRAISKQTRAGAAANKRAPGARRNQATTDSGKPQQLSAGPASDAAPTAPPQSKSTSGQHGPAAQQAECQSRTPTGEKHARTHHQPPIKGKIVVVERRKSMAVLQGAAGAPSAADAGHAASAAMKAVCSTFSLAAAVKENRVNRATYTCSELVAEQGAGSLQSASAGDSGSDSARLAAGQSSATLSTSDAKVASRSVLNSSISNDSSMITVMNASMIEMPVTHFNFNSSASTPDQLAGEQIDKADLTCPVQPDSSGQPTDEPRHSGDQQQAPAAAGADTIPSPVPHIVVDEKRSYDHGVNNNKQVFQANLDTVQSLNHATNETCFMTMEEDSDIFDAQAGRTVLMMGPIRASTMNTGDVLCNSLTCRPQRQHTHSASSYCGSSLTMNEDEDLDDCVDDELLTDDCNGLSISCGLDQYSSCIHCQECEREGTGTDVTAGSTGAVQVSYGRVLNQLSPSRLAADSPTARAAAGGPRAHRQHECYHQQAGYEDNLSMAECRSNDDSSSFVGHDVLDATERFTSPSKKKLSVIGTATEKSGGVASGFVGYLAERKRSTFGGRLGRLGSNAPLGNEAGGLLDLASRGQPGANQGAGGARNLKALRQNFLMKLNQLTAKSAIKSSKTKPKNIEFTVSGVHSSESCEASVDCATTSNIHSGDYQQDTTTNDEMKSGMKDSSTQGGHESEELGMRRDVQFHEADRHPVEGGLGRDDGTTRHGSQNRQRFDQSAAKVHSEINNNNHDDEKIMDKSADMSLMFRDPRKQGTVKLGGNLVDLNDSKLPIATTTKVGAKSGNIGPLNAEKKVSLRQNGFKKASVGYQVNHTSGSGSHALPSPGEPVGGVGPGGGSQTSRAYLASDNERHKRKLAKARERRATLILGLIMAAFICSWMPFFTFYVIRAVCVDCREYMNPRFEAFIFWMGYCNSAINPIIYTIFNRDFRKAFRKILFKCL